MKKVVDVLTEIISKSFEKSKYDSKYGSVTISNRKTICQYQCNGALTASRIYNKNPLDIALEVVDNIDKSNVISKVIAVKPGFINITLTDEYLALYLNEMNKSDTLGYEKKIAKKIIVDYGGPNIAKPLHVGHLRSAVIGESIKRINKFVGNEVIGDIHIGDWGLQMGIVILELKSTNPELVYFNKNFDGSYPKVPPFTIDELSEMYPIGSKKSKEDPVYLNEAREITAKLQKGEKGYIALWKHICDVSIHDLKANYEKLNIEFDLWNGESHCQKKIPYVVDYLIKLGLTKKSEGALIIDVKEENDNKPMPPFIVLKSDGASLYSTTDLTTIYQRIEEFNPDEIIYVVDKRQELHFEQVFRVAHKANIVTINNKLSFIGFGTMNGKDRKPFKTRDGGVMKLEDLIEMLRESVKEKMDKDYTEERINSIASSVGLAALKYGDLINQATKDYIFDIDKFASFEGKTGPYILYTTVRMKSIINKADVFINQIYKPISETERNLFLKLVEFNQVIEISYLNKQPSKLCEYMFDLSNIFNRFYHETKILTEGKEKQKNSWLSLLTLIVSVLDKSLDLLGIDTMEMM